MCDAVHWIAYYADDPAECITWAANEELLPKLEAEELTAVGRKDRTGDYVEIPSTALVDVELFPLDPDGGHILPKNHGARGARWGGRLWKDDLLRLWPRQQQITLTPANGGIDHARRKISAEAEAGLKRMLAIPQADGGLVPRPKPRRWCESMRDKDWRGTEKRASTEVGLLQFSNSAQAHGPMPAARKTE